MCPARPDSLWSQRQVSSEKCNDKQWETATEDGRLQLTKKAGRHKVHALAVPDRTVRDGVSPEDSAQASLAVGS